MMSHFDNWMNNPLVRMRTRFLGMGSLCLRRRRGQAAVEIIPVIFLFVCMLTGLVGISIYLYLQHALITAAREGARIGALDPDLGGVSQQAGIERIRERVQEIMAGSTGQNVPDSDIAVTPPDPTAATGDRQVRVVIDYRMPNPLQISKTLTGDDSGDATINLHASATMRYEE
jgi:hypothetical protein